MNRFHPRRTAAVLAASALVLPAAATATELYVGAGTTGVELGVATGIAGSVGTRLDADLLRLHRDFNSSDIDYDATLKFANAGAYLDWFVYDAWRLSGGALVGTRRMQGTAKSIGSTLLLNGVPYPVVAGDSLNFDAKFPTVSPYLGIGYGHGRQGAGLRFYADAGVAFGRPKVTLSPTASLASKISPSDLAGERSSAQDKADRYRFYSVLKIGFGYAF